MIDEKYDTKAPKPWETSQCLSITSLPDPVEETDSWDGPSLLKNIG